MRPGSWTTPVRRALVHASGLWERCNSVTMELCNGLRVQRLWLKALAFVNVLIGILLFFLLLLLLTAELLLLPEFLFLEFFLLSAVVGFELSDLPALIASGIALCRGDAWQFAFFVFGHHGGYFRSREDGGADEHHQLFAVQFLGGAAEEIAE